MAFAYKGTIGNDIAYGTDRYEMMNGDYGDDMLSGLGGNDSLYGDFGNDNLDGGYGNDFLSGGDGDDYLTGAQGSDNLYGNSGHDVLKGGYFYNIDNPYTIPNEVDYLTGGTGVDWFVLGSSSGPLYYDPTSYAVITDFSFSEMEKLWLFGNSSLYSTGPTIIQPSSKGVTSATKATNIFFKDTVIAKILDTESFNHFYGAAILENALYF